MVTNNAFDDLKEYQKQQQELAGILRGAAEVTCSLKMSKEKELSELSTKVQNDTFKIMVTGTFKNGKSTFINALLGEEILPAYALPCTAIINEVKYGTEKHAILHFRDQLPDPLPEKLAPKAVQHMNKFNGQHVPPMEIPYDEIKDYVVIPMGADEKQMKLQSPYEKVELFYPLEILKNGVEIIDSPGLNEDETRTRVTMDYLSKVDAILYVLNANAICAGDEMRFVKNDLYGNYIDSVFFIVNRFDQIRPREQPQIRQYAELKLKEFYPQPEVFCISALNALDGRLDNDTNMVEASGIIPLEKRLTEFLTKEKGKAKLASPAKQVRQILSREALEVVIPREKKLLDSSLDELKEKYERIKPRLKAVVARKEQQQAEMKTKIERSSRKLERLAKRHMTDMINAVPAWIEEFTPATSLGAIPSKEKTEQVMSELSDYLKKKLSEAQADWQKNVLQPEIEDEARAIFSGAEKDLSLIHKEIDAIDVELTGRDYNKREIPFWQRVAGAAGGFAIGGIGLAFSAGVNGIGKEFATSAAFHFGSLFILNLLGLFNPITLIAVVLANLIGNFMAGANRAMEALKSRVRDEVVKNMTDKAEEQAKELADGIEKNLNEIADQIIDSISKEITDVDEQVKAVIREMQQGQMAVDARKEELAECEKKIHDLNGRLDTLIFALVGA